MKLSKNQYRVIGLMSGTSMDGLDICCVDFKINNVTNVTFSVIHCETIQYTSFWKQRLKDAHLLSAMELQALDAEYGKFIGQTVSDFVQRLGLKDIDLVASHGHTIFHQPERGFTLQIGAGSHIAAQCGMTVVSDFRSGDVALGGQGAPLVPIGDQLLFSDYDACVNLGGFANISFDYHGNRVAFDICPVNIVLNELCQKIGQEYDAYGEIAKAQLLDQQLLDSLNQLPFYRQSFPKSLGREWVESYINPLLEASEISIERKIATFTHHIAQQLNLILSQLNATNILLSGGGAYNDYLIGLLNVKGEIHLPPKEIIEFKEALVFAFLGVLRIENQVNVLSSVTGACRDSSSGMLWEL